MVLVLNVDDVHLGRRRRGRHREGRGGPVGRPSGPGAPTPRGPASEGEDGPGPVVPPPTGRTGGAAPRPGRGRGLVGRGFRCCGDRCGGRCGGLPEEPRDSHGTDGDHQKKGCLCVSVCGWGVCLHSPFLSFLGESWGERVAASFSNDEEAEEERELLDWNVGRIMQ